MEVHGVPLAEEVTLVRGAYVLTMGPAGAIQDGAVAIGGDGAILDVGPHRAVAAAFPGAVVVGDEHGMVLPGFVNAHSHLSEALVPGMAEHLTLWEWGAALIHPVGAHLTAEMARVGTLLKGAEMALSGVTTVAELFCHRNPIAQPTVGVVDGLEELGLRGVVAYGASDMHPLGGREGGDEVIDAILAEHHAVAERCAASTLADMRYGLGTVLSQSDALFQAGAAEAARRGWAMHTHIGEVREELTACQVTYGTTTLERCRRSGLLDRPALLAHCIWCDAGDIAAMAAHGASVAHNPVANMILASGVCPVGELRRAGVAVGIGTDGAASNDSQDMLQAIKAAALLQKLHHLQARVISAEDVIAMATIDGALALGIEDRVGSLEVGKRADVVRFRGDRPGLANIHDPFQQVAYCCGPSDIGDVWVDGRRVVAGGEVTTVDLTAVVAASRPLADELVTRAGLREAGLSRLRPVPAARHAVATAP